MKKLAYTSLFSLLFLLITTFVCKLLEFVSFDNELFYVIFGLSGCILSGILYVIFRKHLLVNIIAFIFNGIFLGACLHGWYLFRDFTNPIWVMLLVDLASVCFLWVFYLFLYIPFINKHYNIYVFVYLFVALCGYIALICTTKTTWLSTFGWYMIIEIAFIFALSVGKNELKDLFKAITISTYSVIVVAIIMIIFMLSGDGFDPSGFDPTGDLGLQSPRQNKQEQL